MIEIILVFVWSEISNYLCSKRDTFGVTVSDIKRRKWKGRGYTPLIKWCVFRRWYTCWEREGVHCA